MTDTEPTEKSQYKRLKRGVIRRRGRVRLGRQIDGSENEGESIIRAQHSTPGELIWANEQGALVFTKARYRVGESLALTLMLGDGPPLETVGEVVGVKKVEKHGGYLAKFIFFCPNPEQVETIDDFLLRIDSVVAQEMKMVL